ALVIVLCGLLALVLLAIGANAASAGTISVPVMAVLVLTPLGLVEPFTEVVTAALRWQTLSQVLARLGAVTLAPVESTSGDRTLVSVEVLGLEQVSYRYPETSYDVFEDVSAVASPGNWLVVTGPSGSGKSTLLSLLLRHIDPD